MAAPETEVPTAALTEHEIEWGHRLAGAMFGLGKQQASLLHRMSRSGIDRSAIMLLKTLAMHGPRRSSELATAVHSDPSTVSRQVAGLVRDGLVERQADPARRRRLIEGMHQAAQRGTGLTRQLLAFSRRSALKPEPDVFWTAADIRQRGGAARGVSVRFFRRSLWHSDRGCVYRLAAPRA